MHRRTFLLSAAGVLAQTRRRPNILFLSVDDMNDWVGCLGHPVVKTPNIDALARRGVLFSNTHCASPLCNPSRTALLTGQAPYHTGIYDNEQFWKPNLPEAVTLPMHFKGNGYTVAGAGKVFHHTAGMNPPGQWDEFQLQQFDDPWYRRADWYPWNRKVPAPAGHPFNGLKDFPGEFDWGVPPANETEYGDMRAVDFAQKFLAKQHSKPFFLAIGLWHPHIPMYAPQNYFDLYPSKNVPMPEVPENDLDDVPPIGRKFAAFRREEFDRIVREGKWRDSVRAYLASISFADAMIGKVVRYVEESTYAKDTMIVFWSDNGWHLGEKRHFHKSTLWQRSTHVPMIFAGPGLQQTGVARRQAVSLIDLYPTLVDLCGLPMRKELDGKSLVPLLRSASERRDPVVITYQKGNHAIRNERWRYIRYSDGAEELYDEAADPNEFRNLASDPKLGSIKNELGAFLPTRNADPAPDRNAFEFDFASYTYTRK